MRLPVKGQTIQLRRAVAIVENVSPLDDDSGFRLEFKIPSLGNHRDSWYYKDYKNNGTYQLFTDKDSEDDIISFEIDEKQPQIIGSGKSAVYIDMGH